MHLLRILWGGGLWHQHRQLSFLSKCPDVHDTDRPVQLGHSAASEAFSSASRAIAHSIHTLCSLPRLPSCRWSKSGGEANLHSPKKRQRLLGILRRLNQSPYLIWLVVSATELMSCKYSPSKGRAEPLKPASDPPRIPQPPATGTASRQSLESNSGWGSECVSHQPPFQGTPSLGLPFGKGGTVIALHPAFWAWQEEHNEYHLLNN